jgi:hypothetical protein
MTNALDEDIYMHALLGIESKREGAALPAWLVAMLLVPVVLSSSIPLGIGVTRNKLRTCKLFRTSRHNTQPMA